MYLTSMILSCVLSAQVAADPPLSLSEIDPPLSLSEIDPPRSLSEIEPRRRRMTPPEMIALALTLPEGAGVTGRPLSLLEALSSSQGHLRRLQTTHAYWRLTAAVAEYRFRLDESEQLERLEVRPEETMTLRTARASALAAERMAQLTAVAAQHELAEAAGLPAGAPLPLCADPPHVGPYRTRFEELFSTRTLPAGTRLIDRTLPIHRREIDVRASAIHAAKDALEAAEDAYKLGGAGLAPVLASIQQLGRQRRALADSVCQYNHHIAEYAFAVAGPQTSHRDLVSMLIQSQAEPAQPLVPRADAGMNVQAETPNRSAPPSEVQPATLNEPLPAEGQNPIPPPGAGQPTLAPPQGTSQPPGPQEPASAGPGEEGESVQPAVVERPLVPVPARPPQPTPRTVNKPAVDSQGALPAASGLYPALVDADPAVRAKHLTTALHWNRVLPEPAGQPIELAECLPARSGTDRRDVIAAYWLARQRAAEYQVRAGQIDLLEEFIPSVIEQRHGPSGAEAMLQLRAAKLAADADLLQTRLELLAAQFDLARRSGLPLDGPWPVPATVPHSGPYLLKLEAQPRGLVASWPVRRLAATIPALSDNLQQRAAAVVDADTARSAATATYRAGRQPIDDVLVCISRQTEETLAFLETLTAYNRAIADYALAVLPAAIPGEQLLGTLVVVR